MLRLLNLVTNPNFRLDWRFRTLAIPRIRRDFSRHSAIAQENDHEKASARPQ